MGNNEASWIILPDTLFKDLRYKHSSKILKVSKGAKIRNRYNQVPHLTQDTNGKVTNSQKTPQTPFYVECVRFCFIDLIKQD